MSQPDIHDQIRAEVERRLGIARRADGADWTFAEGEYGPKVGEWSREVNVQMWHCDDEQDGCPDAARDWNAEGRLIELHSPPDSIRRYEYTLRLLDRHQLVLLRGGPGAKYYETTLVCRTCSPPQFAEDAWPCPDIRDLATSLGIEVSS